MRVLPVVVGAALLLAGVLLAAEGAERRARETQGFDPVADRAVGSVRILTVDDDAWTLPRRMHRGATYDVYDGVFELRAAPPEVESVEFTVHMAFAPVGSVPYPWADRFLPTAESYSGAHLQGSPWVPPFGDGVVGVVATHTFEEVGETWRARLALDTARLPPGGSFDWVLGSAYVARLVDGTTWDLQGVAGAGPDHAVEVVEGDALGRALQAGGLVAGALLAAGGFAVGTWGLVGRGRT